MSLLTTKKPYKGRDVPFREPPWWYETEPGLTARLLTPASVLYGTVARRRMGQAHRCKASVPVICIGNFTAGGTGKTPLALWLAERLMAQGQVPVFLTRGYGSAVRNATLVDPERHAAGDVGDEALLLARAARVMVSPDRAAGARAIEASGIGCTVILMDDGLQNPALAKDLTIAVVDGARGAGNGRVIPAGPLRAPLEAQLAATDVIVVNGRGADRDRFAAGIGTSFSGPVLSARAEAAADTAWVRDARLFAFAGIGNPKRFFRLLEGLGATLVGRRTFADHHPFTDAEADRLLLEAAASNAVLVTTEKDFVRIGDSRRQADLKRLVRTVPIRLAFADDGGAILMTKIGAVLTDGIAS
jgi:tetraacyldisaccharide 4'-kinase